MDKSNESSIESNESKSKTPRKPKETALSLTSHDPTPCMTSTKHCTHEQTSEI